MMDTRHLELRPLVFSVWEVFGVGVGLRFITLVPRFLLFMRGSQSGEDWPKWRRTETTGFSERMKRLNESSQIHPQLLDPC